jgi:hypothetical protein
MTDTPAAARDLSERGPRPLRAIGDHRWTRLRSTRSRAAMVRAMMTLIRQGDMSPSAARVAEIASVSLRTVFRQFDDVDTLYREMTRIVEADVLPPHVLVDATHLQALELATSFQAWRRLRQDQDLAIADARAVLLLTVERLLAGC